LTRCEECRARERARVAAAKTAPAEAARRPRTEPDDTARQQAEAQRQERYAAQVNAMAERRKLAAIADVELRTATLAVSWALGVPAAEAERVARLVEPGRLDRAVAVANLTPGQLARLAETAGVRPATAGA
jgi:hypothetical protein